MTWALGVDGCPGGWVGAAVDDRGRVRWRVFGDAPAILADGVEAIAIDIPVGLPDSGPRACDLHARRLLGRRASTVFPAPPRSVLAEETYAGACLAASTANARAISRQTWSIVPRIRDMDGAVTPAVQGVVIESHPEVSFATLAGHPLPPKRRAEGRAARVAALTGWLTDPAAALLAAPRPARPDDALDALAAAWSAWRWLRGAARVLPHDRPPRDSRGLRMEIVA